MIGFDEGMEMVAGRVGFQELGKGGVADVVIGVVAAVLEDDMQDAPTGIVADPVQVRTLEWIEFDFSWWLSAHGVGSSACLAAHFISSNTVA
jgi:hypothetical protein